MEMLKDRGYSVQDEEIKMGKKGFLNKYGKNITRKDLDIKKAKLNDSSDQVFPPLL